MRHITLGNGTKVPALGLGTWKMGEDGRQRATEVKALQRGLDLGLSLIDTAEMYADGGAEQVVAEAIAGRRDAVYLVSKIYPHNASKAGVAAACARSLKRLKTDRLDLYLLHWRGQYALSETVEAFERLVTQGKIKGWGVSNFDADDMAELAGAAKPGACLTNQVLYHLGSRGIEFALLPACLRDGIPVMAYSPLGQGELLDDPALVAIAKARGASSAAVALAWVLRQPGVIAIPKASSLAHVEANAAAQDLVLDGEELAALDRAFPPPKRKTALGML
jgi:diketogulonate reductase-like aldo/keto reductase